MLERFSSGLSRNWRSRSTSQLRLKVTKRSGLLLCVCPCSSRAEMSEALSVQVIQAGEGRTLSRCVPDATCFVGPASRRATACVVCVSLCCRAEFLSLLRTYNCFLKEQTQLHLTYSQVGHKPNCFWRKRLSFLCSGRIGCASHDSLQEVHLRTENAIIN